MGALTLGLALPLLVAVAPSAVDPVARWRAEIAEASARFGIPEAWIERVMRAESGGRTMLGGRPIRSPKGAIGLMQLMPGTWGEMRARLGLGNDPDDPRDNILAGTFYLRLMYDRFGYPGLFGAYNAGPARYAAWREGRARLPAETVAYLARVGTPASGSSVHAAQSGVGAGGAAGAASPPPPPLFVVLRLPPAGQVPQLATVTQRADASSPMDRLEPLLFAIRRGNE